MPTVIDSLMVELGLDASKFDAAQKKSVEQLRKFDTANSKSAKESQIGAEKMADGFLKVKNALLGFTAVALGATGFKEFINQQVFGNAQLGRTANLLGMNAREMDSWGAAVKTVGGTAQGFQQSMQNIEGGIAAFQIGQGGEGVVNGLARLGVQAKNGTVSLTDLSGALVRMKNEFGVQAAMNLAQQIGLDQGTFQLLLKGPAAVQALHDKFYALSGVNQKNIEAAQKLQGEWALLKQSADALGQTLFGEATPALEGLTEAMVKYSSASTQAMNKGGFMALFPQFWKNYKDWVAHPLGGSSASQGSREQSGKVTGNTGVNLDVIRKMESGGNNSAVSPAGALGPYQFMPATAAQYGLKGNDVYDPDKSKEAAGKYFSDLMKHYNGDTDMALAAYNWGQGNVDKKGMGNLPKETRDYIAKYHSMVGAQVATSGLSGGNSSSQVETHIGTINVNTQATDANGVAKGMQKSLQDNALISAGTTGNS